MKKIITKFEDQPQPDSEYIPDPPHIMTIKSFKEGIELGLYTDYDGFAMPVVDGEPSYAERFYPSDISKLSSDVTHVEWVNR